MPHIIKLNFPIHNWNHLYSLQQAIAHNSPVTGRTLGVQGRILNQAFLHHQDTAISIDFIQVDTIPSYPIIDHDDIEQKLYQLGVITLNEQQLSTHIQVDRQVFEELRKNLMEYADIEGIHIMLTLGLLCDNEHWKEGSALQIVQLDYAMKGDA